MAIYKSKPVSEQPELSITQWCVKELADGSRHLVGVIADSGHDGRVSSKIMDFKDGVVTTRSGRKYHLSGESGSSLNALYVWAAWCALNGLDPIGTLAVTHEYHACD